MHTSPYSAVGMIGHSHLKLGVICQTKKGTSTEGFKLPLPRAEDSGFDIISVYQRFCVNVHLS